VHPSKLVVDAFFVEGVILGAHVEIARRNEHHFPRAFKMRILPAHHFQWRR
jgi:hypothetical protein